MNESKNNVPKTRTAARVLIALLTLVTLAYFAVQAAQYFANPFTTAFAYPYEVEDTLELSGYVVRSEEPVDAEAGTFLRLLRTEGERVSAGGVIAAAYADQQSLDLRTELDTLNARLDQLRYARDSVLNGEVSARMDGQIFQILTDYRAELSADRLTRAEQTGSQLRSMILRRDYTNTDLDSIEAEIDLTTERAAGLESKTASAVRDIAVTQSGIWSAVTDGYEAVLTPERVREMKPSALSAVQPTETEHSELGKLVFGTTWYYASTLSDSEIRELRRRGGSFSLRFSKSGERDFPVTLDFVGEEENGRFTVLFRSDKYLSEITMLRRQKAQLILETVSGLRVPREALRMPTKEQINPSPTPDPAAPSPTPDAALDAAAPDAAASMPDAALDAAALTEAAIAEGVSDAAALTEAAAIAAQAGTDDPDELQNLPTQTPVPTAPASPTPTPLQITGLYCVVGTEARFKPVTVLYAGENFLLVASAPTVTREELRLRSGDEVIVQADELYDRKVLSAAG